MAKCTSCGSPLCKGCGSPNKFLGGIAASIGAGMTGAGSGMDNNSLREKLRSSVFGGAAYEAMQQSQAQQAAAGQAVTSPEITGVVGAIAGNEVPMNTSNPFQGKTFKIEPTSPTAMVDPELASAGIQPETTYEPPMQGNQMGNAKPLFNAAVQASAEAIYGTPEQRQMSMPGAPTFFKDQTGDGKITQADVITARTEGYQESPNAMRSPLNDNHPGRNSVGAKMVGKEIPKKMSKTLTKKELKPYTKEQLKARNATIKRGYGVTLDGKRVDLGNITSTEISPKEFKQR